MTAVQATTTAVIAASSTGFCRFAEGFFCRFGEGLLDLCRVALIRSYRQSPRGGSEGPGWSVVAGSFVILCGKVRD